MKDIYTEYTGELFPYFYPITWDNRDPEYLNIVEDRDTYQDYMFPPETEGEN